MKRKVLLKEDPVVINDYDDLKQRIKGWHLFGVGMNAPVIRSYSDETSEILKGVLKIDHHDNIVTVFLNSKHFKIKIVDLKELKDMDIYHFDDYEDLIEFLNKT